MPDKIDKIDLMVLILFTAIALIIPAVVVMRHFYLIDPIAVLNINWGRTVVACIFTVLATLVFLLNFYLYHIAPRLYEREHGNMDNYYSMSGLPVICGIFVLIAGVLMPPSVIFATALLAIYILDPNGLPFFLFNTARGNT